MSGSVQIAFPFHVQRAGGTASASADEHVRQLIEQALFTTPGERVNRPTFGCGLLKLVFAPLGDALTSVASMAVQGSLQQWLGDVAQVHGVSVQVDDTTLTVTVSYQVSASQPVQVAEFTRQT